MGLLLVASHEASAGAIVPPGTDNFQQLEPCIQVGGGDITCGWLIGTMTVPIPVAFDPIAGPWLKTLEIDKFEDNAYFVHETLEITGTVAWTDWHEEILTAGWAWDTGAMIATSTGDQVSGILSQNDTVLDFFFSSPLPAGQNVTVSISKRLLFIGGGNAPIGTSLDVAQSPTVPAPPAVWQLSLGLGLLALRLRYAARHARG